MKSEQSNQTREQCVTQCEKEYIRYTARKPVGGAEILRVCRDGCPGDAPEEKRPAE